MSQFKPLSEVIAGKMVADLKTGNSIFQRPNNHMNSALPFNLESGNRYTGPSALVLLMQKRDDPRWSTSNQANRNHTAVMKGATGTLISFFSQYALRKALDEKGQEILKESGKPRYERVKLEQPELVEAWLFNAEQMRKMDKWEKAPNVLEPAERAQLILENSGAVIVNGGDDMVYDLASDTIILPEQEQFANIDQYYAEALHQLAHRVAALKLEQSQEGPVDQSANSKLELRTNLASLYLSKELNLPFDLNYHVGYTTAWAQILKDEPAELFQAAFEAQQIVDEVLGFEKEIEQKVEQEAEQEVGPEIADDLGAGGFEDLPKVNPDKLNKGEVIPHNGTEFKVVSELKNKVYQMQDTGTGRKFKMSSNDELFKALLEVRNNSQEQVLDRSSDLDEHQDEHFEEVCHESEEQGNNFEISR